MIASAANPFSVHSWTFVHMCTNWVKSRLAGELSPSVTRSLPQRRIQPRDHARSLGRIEIGLPSLVARHVARACIAPAALRPPHAALDQIKEKSRGARIAQDR